MRETTKKNLPHLPEILRLDAEIFAHEELTTLLERSVIELSDEEFERLFEENSSAEAPGDTGPEQPARASSRPNSPASS